MQITEFEILVEFRLRRITAQQAPHRDGPDGFGPNLFRSAAVSLRLLYVTRCWWPSPSGCIRIAATAMLLASVVNTARRAGSRLCNTSANERAPMALARRSQPLPWLERVQVRLRCTGPLEPCSRSAAVSGAAISAQPTTKRR